MKTLKRNHLYILLSLFVIIILINLFSLLKNDTIIPVTTAYSSKKLYTEVIVPVSIVNIGEIKKDSLAEATFKIINKGKNYLTIEKVEVDCHCTVPFWTKKPISPSDSTYVKVKYDSSKPGFFQKKLMVYINASKSPLLLIFRGNVIS